MAKKILKGIIVSDKPDKTVVARVDRFVRHKRLEKVYRVSKKYFVHDPENKYRAGDKVAIEESRPFSKKKRWVIKNEYDTKSN